MSAFLLLLVKLNLAMGAAIVLVSLLRRPLRVWFGAPIAYAIWFAVPMAGLASLLPPREAAPVPVTWALLPAAPVSVMGPIAHSAMRVTEQLTGQSPLTAIAVPPPAAYAIPDTALLLLAAWALGALFMALYLTRLQLRFSAAVRAGEAGPAVLGFMRPRIVTPDGFQERFTPKEQAAILAHERVHLARQDARINALAALLRCLCWFNPLIHLGARWLRIDQELACDASVVATAISRRHYATALLKSQMVVTSLPLGCNWPGAQHPLIERVALLKRKPPGTARRLAGVGVVVLAATSAGLGAWAAQPPAAAKPMTARQPGIALAALPVSRAGSVAAPSQAAGQPVANANPTGSGNEVDASKTVRANEVVSAEPVPAGAQTPGTVSIAARAQSALAAQPQIAPVSEPSDKADQSTIPTSQVASSEPKETLAKNTTAAPATGDAATAGAASGAPLVAAIKPVVMPDTPSGAGDPNTIVCRARQRIAGSDQFGPLACGHNYEWWKLAMNGKDLAPDGKTLIAAIGLPPIALAKTDAAAHTETASALRCLLNKGQNGCGAVFVGGARLAARFWVGPNPDRDFERGALVSSEYARTETGENVYIARLLDRRTTDIYDVKFRNQEMTFYIARPQPDGKIDHLLIRNGSPDPADERMDMFVRGPG